MKKMKEPFSFDVVMTTYSVFNIVSKYPNIILLSRPDIDVVVDLEDDMWVHYIRNGDKIWGKIKDL